MQDGGGYEDGYGNTGDDRLPLVAEGDIATERCACLVVGEEDER